MSLFFYIHAWVLVCPGGTWGPQELGELQGSAGVLSPSFGSSNRGWGCRSARERVSAQLVDSSKERVEISAETRSKVRCALRFSRPRGPARASSVGRMDRRRRGGALAAGDAGKPGAPEDATRAGESEVEGEG